MPGEDHFAPPPSNISIRTMKGDETAIRTGGGQVPETLPIARPVPPPAPSREPFLAATGRPTPPPAPPVPPPPPTLVHGAGPQKQPSRPSLPKIEFKGRLLIGVIALGVVVLAVVAYFIISALRTTESPSPSPSPSISPSPSLPQILFNPPAETQKAVEVGSDARNALAEEAGVTELAGTLKTLTFTQNQTPLTLDAFLNALMGNPPQRFLASLAGPYSIELFYVSAQDAHAGLVFLVKPEGVGNLKALLKEWEIGLTESSIPRKLETDFSALLLGRTVSATKTPAFLDGNLNGIPTRYMVYGGPSGLAFDYAFIESGPDTYLLFTTHRDAVVDFIRRLKP